MRSKDARCRRSFNAVPASRKAASLRYVEGKIFFGDRSKEDHEGGCFIASHFSQKTRETGHPVPSTHISQGLLADAELPNDCLIALGIVSLEVVEQATPLADQHE